MLIFQHGQWDTCAAMLDMLDVSRFPMISSQEDPALVFVSVGYKSEATAKLKSTQNFM